MAMGKIDIASAAAAGAARAPRLRARRRQLATTCVMLAACWAWAAPEPAFAQTGSLQELGPAPGQAPDNLAAAISNNGLVLIGRNQGRPSTSGQVSASTIRAYRWSAADGFADLGLL